MESEFGLGSGLAGLLLTINTLTTLLRKGILSPIEAREIIDHASINLETHERLAGEMSQNVIRDARTTLESIRAQL